MFVFVFIWTQNISICMFEITKHLHLIHSKIKNTVPNRIQVKRYFLAVLLHLFSDVSRLSEEGEMPLMEMKQKVHILSEKTAQELKKNVYKNYSQFIETAREISSILSEHCQPYLTIITCFHIQLFSFVFLNTFLCRFKHFHFCCQ